MSLNRKQVRFTRKMAQFLVWCFENGYHVILAEAFRPRWVAEEYAKQGKGIKNSVHTKKLACDLFLIKNGKITWDPEDYRPLGKKWKSMDRDARHGLDFRNRDAVHFSFFHKGVA